MKPLALDLCCGKGGWALGLIAAGWDVIGIDVEEWDGFPGRRIIKDVRELTVEDVRALDQRSVSLVVASPPCQEFSYRSFPFKHCRYLRDNVPPDKTIWEACEKIAKELDAPMILENVRGAERYMGKAKAHYGSYYLWGNVPALLPMGNPRKGFTRVKDESFSGGRDGKQFRGNTPVSNLWRDITHMREARDGKMYRKIEGTPTAGKHGSRARKEWSAKVAIIPIELSTWIGEVFYPRERKAI